MPRTVMCKRCVDEGAVPCGFLGFRRKTCPKCNGNPQSQLPPCPSSSPAPPPAKRAAIEVTLSKESLNAIRDVVRPRWYGGPR
jgi:hypothetical protein